MKFYSVFWTGAPMRDDGTFFGIYTSKKKARKSIERLAGQTENPASDNHYKIIPVKVNSKKVKKSLKDNVVAAIAKQDKKKSTKKKKVAVTSRKK